MKSLRQIGWIISWPSNFFNICISLYLPTWSAYQETMSLYFIIWHVRCMHMYISHHLRNQNYDIHFFGLSGQVIYIYRLISFHMKTNYNNVWLKQKKLRVFSIRNFMKTGSLLTFWESQNYVMSWIRFTGYHYTKWTSWNSSSREWEWKAVHTVLYFDRLTTNISPETQQFNTNDKSSGKKLRNMILF